MSLRVGIVQFAPVADRGANARTVGAHVRDVCGRGAELVVIPELWTCEYDMSTVGDHCESIPGESTDFLCDLARELQVWLVGGTVPEARAGRVLNTCPVISPDGRVAGTYSKRRLFKANIPGRVVVDEGDVFTAGALPFSFAVGEFKIGVGVCFDVRFPELALAYARDGCNVLVFPSAFTRVTGQMHWKLLGRARALDTQAWVVMVSSSYDEAAKFKGNGQSFIADPAGAIAFELGDGEGCGVFEIDAARVREARAAIPVVARA